MKTEPRVFATLMVVGFLTGCAVLQSSHQEGSQTAAMLEPLKTESENTFEPTTEVKEGEVVTEVNNDESQYDRKFADWTITKITDSVKTESQLLACSRFYQDGHDNGESRLCFRFYDKDFVVVEPQGVSGKGYWPYCEYDHIPYHVDDNGPGVVPTIKSGLCADDLDTAQEHFIQELKKGKTLHAQLNSSRGKVRLNGFGSAWDYAVAQF